MDSLAAAGAVEKHGVLLGIARIPTALLGVRNPTPVPLGLGQCDDQIHARILVFDLGAVIFQGLVEGDHDGALADFLLGVGEYSRTSAMTNSAISSTISLGGSSSPPGPSSGKVRRSRTTPQSASEIG
jgi:hypothetical protein